MMEVILSLSPCEAERVTGRTEQDDRQREEDGERREDDTETQKRDAVRTVSNKKKDRKKSFLTRVKKKQAME